MRVEAINTRRLYAALGVPRRGREYPSPGRRSLWPSVFSIGSGALRRRVRCRPARLSELSVKPANPAVNRVHKSEGPELLDAPGCMRHAHLTVKRHAHGILYRFV
jgi:hypothetical protein